MGTRRKKARRTFFETALFGGKEGSIRHRLNHSTRMNNNQLLFEDSDLIGIPNGSRTRVAAGREKERFVIKIHKK
ncbi:hypothetical protein GQ61_02565 [Candidatus Nucleicultrix amoebiphila FS5]|jgi:hypothetical protein|uniref:Uncharacterized protein n=1 Tax=Candidatus Nucleicultrix amoebiphila FS5 TaxID=1414854 RepID=A0A1W6N3D3_9PROT|nr:hypothetical protein [Candidatus Nucleicultrix amoebiphila]ARN84390.1 hypothetical protein GQ61_02565 [Candidatus Nucleicultrix amoebiphila FS5]